MTTVPGATSSPRPHPAEAAQVQRTDVLLVPPARRASRASRKTCFSRQCRLIGGDSGGGAFHFHSGGLK
ncbi:unnamed protein product [Lampetra fluviatilis]